MDQFCHYLSYFLEAVIFLISNILKEILNAQLCFIPQLGKSKDKDVDLMLK